MTPLTPRRPAWRACAGILLVAFAATVCPGTGWVAAARADAAADLEQARYHFDFGEYAEAGALLTRLIEGSELTGPALRDAHVLRARCALAQGQEAMARDDFCAILAEDPDWRPDPVQFTPDEVAGFEAVRAECAPAPAPVPAPAPAAQEDEGGTPFFAKPVVWIVAGAAVVGGLLLAGGGGDDTPPPADPLPDPPPPPAK